MAERSTGPVKPPVIDLTPRNTNTPPPDSGATAAPKARTSARPGNLPLLGGAVLSGAVLGTALTYLLSGVVPLPGRAPDLTAPLGEQATRVDDLNTRLFALEGASAETQSALEATTGRLETGLADLGRSIEDVRAAIPALPDPVDLTPLEEQLATLKAQIDAVAAGASGTDASAIATSLSALDAGLASLGTRLNGVDQTIVALRADIETTRDTLVTHVEAALPNEAGPLLKLPLILSGLESAFETGRPFADELRTVRDILPQLPVPAALESAANAGLVRPDRLAVRFADALPAILSARATGSDDWMQSALDWTKGVLALRPIEEIEGETPDAIVSRLEGAMARRDFTAARDLLASLPAPMQAAAEPVAADIGAHADAQGFIAGLRARALDSAEAPAEPAPAVTDAAPADASGTAAAQ